MRKLRHRLIYLTVIQLASGSWNLNSKGVALGLLHYTSTRDWGLDQSPSAKILAQIRQHKDDDFVNDVLVIILSKLFFYYIARLLIFIYLFCFGVTYLSQLLVVIAFQ